MNLSKTYFTTLAINNFIPVFEDYPECVGIVLNSFNDIVDSRKCNIYAFVIMKDHIHLVWEMHNGQHVDDLITSFKKYTGRLISNYIKSMDEEYHNLFMSERQDRKYKIWKLTKGNILIHSHQMLVVKICYIHNNPAKGDYQVVEECTKYLYSSALAYSKQSSNFRFLTVLEGIVPWF